MWKVAFFVIDQASGHWTIPEAAYQIKTLWADAEFTPVKWL